MGLMLQRPVTASQPAAITTNQVGTVHIVGSFGSDVFLLKTNGRRCVEKNPRSMFSFAWIVPKKQLPHIVIFTDIEMISRFQQNILPILQAVKIRYREPDRTLNCPAYGQAVQVHIASGIDSTFQVTVISRLERDTLDQFVYESGRYEGLCAGAYLAWSGLFWQTDKYSVRMADSTLGDNEWKSGAYGV